MSRTSTPFQLLGRFLCMDPSKRIQCDAALDHGFFWVDPLHARQLASHAVQVVEVDERVERAQVEACKGTAARLPYNVLRDSGLTLSPSLVDWTN